MKNVKEIGAVLVVPNCSSGQLNGEPRQFLSRPLARLHQPLHQRHSWKTSSSQRPIMLACHSRKNGLPTCLSTIRYNIPNTLCRFIHIHIYSTPLSNINLTFSLNIFTLNKLGIPKCFCAKFHTFLGMDEIQLRTFLSNKICIKTH